MRYVWLLVVVACLSSSGIAFAAAPVANFSASSTSGTAPLTVNFTDSSTNSPTSWSWSFGDGTTSTSANPSHQYTSPRAYSVSLTVSNASGTDTQTKEFYISVLGSGTTYYVATTGSDNNPGTEAQPFATIQKGLDTVTAGDTLIVQDGTYSDAPQTWAVGAVRSTGTAADPVVIRAATKWGAVIDGLNANQRGFYICGKGDACAQAAQYVTLQGFEIKNCWLSSSSAGSGVDLDGYANHCVIRDNHIHHIANFASTSSVGNDGSWEDERCTYTTWDSNVIHDIGRTSGQVNLDHGIYLCGDHGTVTNNTIHDCKVGNCIQIAGYYSTVDTLLVSNNTLANGLNRGHIVVWGDVDNTTIQNNIFYNIPSGLTAISFSSARKNTNDVIRYNLWYGGTGLGPSNTDWTYSNNINADPLFVDAASYDYHLTSSSPAKDAGTAASAPSIDQDGVTRPINSSYDIGAFEYIAGGGGGGGNPPVANFSGNPTSGSAPLTVYFTDSSTNTPTSWSWAFGDGGTSQAQNPSHEYTTANTYTVSLTATNQYGSDDEVKTGYITVSGSGGGDYYCSSETTVQGGLVSGDHTYTHSSDDSYLVVASVQGAQNRYWIEEDYSFSTGLSGLSSLGYSMEAHNNVNPNAIDYTIEAYNYSTSAWDSVGLWTITGTADATYSNSISNPSSYISGGTVKLKIVAKKGQTWQLAMDLVKITAAP